MQRMINVDGSLLAVCTFVLFLMERIKGIEWNSRVTLYERRILSTFDSFHQKQDTGTDCK
jgi:hypothetical protein